MTATIKIAISIQKTLFDQVETLAHQLNISQNHLVGMALEHFIKNYPSQALFDDINKVYEDQSDSPEPAKGPDQEGKTVPPIGEGRRVINQGEIYWVPLEEPSGSESGYTHPHVVIQDNVFNRSRINTVVVCALTSNLKRAKEPVGM